MGMAAEQPAEKASLRVSQTLAPRPAPDEAERALLRLEARVGQTLHDDRAVISDLLARITRMTAVVADIHKLLTDMPVGKPCKAVAVPCPTVPTTPATHAGAESGDMSDLPWPAIVGGASILGLLAFWLARRSRKSGHIRQEMSVDLFSSGATQTKPPPAQKPTVKVSAQIQPLPMKSKKEAAAKPAAAPNEPLKVSSIRPKPAPPPPPVAPTAMSVEFPPKPKGEADMSLELADVMLSMGLTDGAAQTLSDHIRANPRQALYHWLKLLDVYRQSGMKLEFEKAAADLQHHFNMAPPEWLETQQAAVAKVDKLEDYPHIASRVQELWPHRTCAEYLSRLLEDTRGGTRAGFPKPVVEEILLLLSLIKD